MIGSSGSGGVVGVWWGEWLLVFFTSPLPYFPFISLHITILTSYPACQKQVRNLREWKTPGKHRPFPRDEKHLREGQHETDRRKEKESGGSPGSIGTHTSVESPCEGVQVFIRSHREADALGGRTQFRLDDVVDT